MSPTTPPSPPPSHPEPRTPPTPPRVSLEQLDGLPALVDRCVCMDITFAEMLELVEQERLTLQGLMARTGCGTGCTSCRGYVRLVLATGRDRLPVLEPAQIEGFLDR